MAEKRSVSVPSGDVFVILAQIFGAFGHGAGGLLVDRDVVRRATKDYTPVVEHNANKWDTLEVAVLEAARMTGRLAAHRAVSEQRVRISVPDYLGAIQVVILGCPFLHPHPGDEDPYSEE